MEKVLYSAPITSRNPALIVFLIDQSGSMSEPTRLDGTDTTKAEALAAIVNNTLEELLARCKRDDAYRDYVHIGILGYCGDTVVSAVTGDTGRCVLLKPSELAGMEVPVKTFNRERILPTGETVVCRSRQREWIAPKAYHTTPMKKALEEAHAALKEWTSSPRHRESFPPIVINITDGEATDGSDEEIRNIAGRIRGLGTADGHTLLFNIHISGNMDLPAVSFPAASEELPAERYARLLFDISSRMPESYHDRLETLLERKIDSRGVKALSYNADMAEVLKMINIGSISINFIR